MDKGRILKIAAKAGMIALLIAATTFACIKFAPQMAYLVSNPEEMRSMLSSYGSVGIIIFILIQIIQVIIAFLPGDVTQLAGGYIYGILPGTLYSTVGITIGSVIVFFTSRWLGHSLLNVIVSKEIFEKFSFLINSPKAELAMFIIFLLPGMPKDFLSYIAGITPVKPMKFLAISSIARFPALFASTYIGANLQQGNMTIVIIVTVAACLLIIAGYLMKDKILGLLHGNLSKEIE